MPGILEVCTDSLESVDEVIDIVQIGENRFELCSNLIYGGGMTPSVGLVAAINQKYPKARIMVIIRPRIGDFVYSNKELEVMEREIQTFKMMNVMGFVFGCLTSSGEVDIEASVRLAKVAAPYQVTFHRAFDVTRNPFQALNDIIEMKLFSRILTSGQTKNVLNGAPLISKLQSEATSIALKRNIPAITILPGGGVTKDTVIYLKEQMPSCNEVHMTGGHIEYDGSADEKSNMFGFGTGKWTMGRQKVLDVWDIIKEWD